MFSLEKFVIYLKKKKRKKRGERKISFVLHEPDGNSEECGATTSSNQGDDSKLDGQGSGLSDDKKSRKAVSCGRPYLLRRSTASGTSGSIKRRSFRFKKSANKESGKENSDSRKPSGKDLQSETKKSGIKDVLKEKFSDSKKGGHKDDESKKFCGKDNDPDHLVRRVDSIQSKRQKGSLSDRSDTSELCLSGGEESPGIMESPDEQIPESPSDSNDPDDTSVNMPWIKVYGEELKISEMNSFFEKLNDKNVKNQKSTDFTNFQISTFERQSLHRGVETTYNFGNDYIPKRNPKLISAEKKTKDQSMMLRYVKTQVKDSFHSPLAIIVKSIVILSEEHVIDILPVAWELLLESNQEVVATAASLFIVTSFKAPGKAIEIMQKGLQNSETAVRINAILRFQVLWRHRYQAWPRMEERAQTTFRLPPPSIEFTLTSPKIGIESLPVVDPPWMTINAEIPVNKFPKAEESHRQLSARKTTEKREVTPPPLAYHAVKHKVIDGRESFLITAIPIVIQAAYETNIPHAVGDVDHDEGDDESCDTQETGKSQGQQQQQQQQSQLLQKGTGIHGQSLPVLFPSCLCSAVVDIVTLLDDAAVSADGNSVYEIAYQVIWNCLVEDSSLFLRYILERLTRDKQELMFKILRHLIRFVPKLPQQAAFALYNYIIGYVMFYVRSPHENGQKMIGAALSVLWMVVHSVHGIMFKDLKQILRKEQCDMAILLTAHAPSAKKIIVHGPQEQDGGGIPSQFPVQEDTQFCQLWRESLDYFNIDEKNHKEYFLVDHKTHQIHNLNSYVRDYYCFKRSQYPQLELIHMKPEEAFNALQRQELVHKFIEIGKVLLTWAILKNVDMVMQRVVFLHEELIKIGSFPRKALAADLDLYKGGEMGKVEGNCLFQLLLSLETPSPDPLNIGELVKEEKPLKAIDFCYHDESEMINVVDCISLCVMVISYAADSLRAYQMLVILEAILPCYLKQIQSSKYRKQDQSEREIIAQLAVSIKTLVNNCEALTKNYNGPQRTSPEHKTSSQRNYSKGPYSPAYDYEEDSKYITDRGRTRITYDRDADDSEQVLRTDFRRPRDVLLSTVADFVTKSSCRLIELYKMYPDSKHVELLDQRSYVRLADIAITLLKVSPYDPETMGCKGLQRYMTHLLPATDWSNETMRQTLLTMLRRIDKMFVKIHKKTFIRRQVDWNAASGILKGVYETLFRYPVIVTLQPMKALINTCQALITADIADIGQSENISTTSVVVMSKVPPSQFTSIVIKLIVLQILAFNDTYTLEMVCGSLCGSSFSSTLSEKVENTLVNFLLPFCLKVGGGARDQLCIRQNDITFALNAILNFMSPLMTSTKPTATGSQNFKTMSEGRTASVTYNMRDSKTVSGLTPSVYKIGFLGLKIIQICFESQLNSHWQKIAAVLKDISKVTEARISFWSYVEFLVVFRNPLFIILLPFIQQKIIQPTSNETEKIMQLRIKEKLTCFNPSPPVCRAALVVQLRNELRDLRTELDNKKIELDSKGKEGNSGSLDIPNQRTSFSDYLDNHHPVQCENLTHRGSITSTQGSGSLHEASFPNGVKDFKGEIFSSNEEYPLDYEGKPFISKLHRSKAQSRKTFRFRKSRIDQKSQTKSAPASINVSEVQSPTDVSAQQISTPQLTSSIQMSKPPVTSQVTFETSWEEESLLSQTTSSTSGYRENCSLLMMQLESPREIRHCYPSSSNSTLVPPVSPESFESDDDVRSSQHSILMMYGQQDKNTML
ncbi:hypothetical protein PGB90_008039 [Kerria lacca]